MSERTTLSVTDRVATITLTRADKRNALDFEMLRSLVDTAEGLIDRRDIRAVVLQAAGSSFCAGLDTSAFQELVNIVNSQGGLTARTHGDANLFQRAAMVFRDIPVPVIAALQGHVYGGGFQIMLGADMRIAAPGCKFSIREGKWGLIPDMGGMVLMRDLMRGDMIRRLTYTAEVFDTEAANEYGLVTEIADDPQARAHELARMIAAQSPEALREAKALITATERTTRADTLMLETEAQLRLIGTPNQMEAIMAGLTGKTPDFKD